MDEHILESVKKMLGLDIDYDYFDMDVIIHINTVFAILNQMGVGPKEVFSISDNTSIWSDFTENDGLLSSVKTFMYMRVQMMFDPPTSSAVANAKNEIIKELEWRLYSYSNFNKEES